MAINSREKGKRGERLVAKKLKEFGYDARRGQQFAGINGDADVVGLPRVHVEVKFTERLNIWKALDQSKRDAREDEMPTVFFKKNKSDVYVAMPLEEFMEMYQAWEREVFGGHGEKDGER